MNILHLVVNDNTNFSGSAIVDSLVAHSHQAGRGESVSQWGVSYQLLSTQNRQVAIADVAKQSAHARMLALSTCDIAAVPLDAREGLTSDIAGRMRFLANAGVDHIIFLIANMDLVDWEEQIFRRIFEDCSRLAEELKFASYMGIPVSIVEGGNLIQPSKFSRWYSGPTLMGYLECAENVATAESHSFRMKVTTASEDGESGRGGMVLSGKVSVGERVRIVPGGVETQVKSISALQGELERAVAGEFVTLCFEDDIVVNDGDVISTSLDPIELSDQFEAKVICLSSLVPGRPYLIRMYTAEANATLTAVKYVVDLDSGAHLAAKKLDANDIGIVNISVAKQLTFESYKKNKSLGQFLLLDKNSHDPLAIGMIDFALRRASNIHWQGLSIDKKARAELKQQKPCCLWFTGLSGSGKSTIANLLEKRLFSMGLHSYILDGDNVRHGLNRDLGFTEADRVENIRRVAEVARLMVDAGLMVIVSFLSPFRSEREFARTLFDEGEFLEIFVDTPFEECERRDTKGLYAKARRGDLKNFTGIDSPYQVPESPEIRLETVGQSPEACVDKILEAIHV